MNPIYQQIKSQPNGQDGFMARFRSFKNEFTGDPRQKIQQMLNSGQITQAQYNEAVNKANQIIQMLQ